MSRQDEWVVNAEAVAGIATATKAAPSGGKKHVVTAVAASYSAAQIGLLTITIGTKVIKHHVINSDVLLLNLFAPTDTAVSAALAAGAGGVTGEVNLMGYTEG